MYPDLVDYCDRQGLDGLLLFTNSEHTIAQPSFVQYFAGVMPIARKNAVLCSSSGEACILVDLPRDVERISRHTGVEDVRGSRDFEAELADAAADLGVTGRLGVAGMEKMARPTAERTLAMADTVERVDADLVELAGEKDREEIETFRELGRIADAGFRRAYDVVAPGIKEYEVMAELEHEMRKEGSEDNFNFIGSGRHNHLMHAPTDRILREGDKVLFEISPMIDGLVLQLCRTISVGTPSRTLTEKYSLLEEALDLTKREIRPGVESSVISTVMNSVIRDAGYDEYCRPPYMRTRGHEFGLGPLGMSITEDTETPLREDMVLVVHPNQYVPETGYLALGDPILLTEDGFDSLTGVAPRLFTKEVM